MTQDDSGVQLTGASSRVSRSVGITNPVRPGRRSQSLGRNVKFPALVAKPVPVTQSAIKINASVLSTGRRDKTTAWGAGKHVSKPAKQAVPKKQTSLQPLLIMIKRRGEVVERKEATKTINRTTM